MIVAFNEPWEIKQTASNAIELQDKHGQVMCEIIRDNPGGGLDQSAWEIAYRIKNCVNAMRGIEKPTTPKKRKLKK
jgi:hypothetical protein